VGLAPKLVLLVATGALLATLSASAIAERRATAEGDDSSGIFGKVPEYAKELRRLEGQVALTRRSLDDVSRPNPRGMATSLRRNEQLLESVKNRCVEAFDLASRLPLMYSGESAGKASTPSGGKRCVDRARFPSGFMKVVASARCASDGSFRLALRPGHYAVVAARLPAGIDEAESLVPQLVTVKSHQWLQVTPWQEQEVARRDGASRVKAVQYNSGVKGRGPSQSEGCYGVPGPATRREWQQCVEAYSPGDNAMLACAECDPNGEEFTLPLAAGTYEIEFDAEKQTGSDNPVRRVTIAMGQWLRIDAKGAGIKPMPCPRLP
jgi:hypothetical protein